MTNLKEIKKDFRDNCAYAAISLLITAMFCWVTVAQALELGVKHDVTNKDYWLHESPSDLKYLGVATFFVLAIASFLVFLYSLVLCVQLNAMILDEKYYPDEAEAVHEDHLTTTD